MTRRAFITSLLLAPFIRPRAAAPVWIAGPKVRWFLEHPMQEIGGFEIVRTWSISGILPEERSAS